jgi:L,D-transpeptidase ErfK/SrfK
MIMMKRLLLTYSLLLPMILSPTVNAQTFFVSPFDKNFTVGHEQEIIINYPESIESLARRYDLGYNELINANPEINPKGVHAGDVIHLPTAFHIPPHKLQEIIISLKEQRLYYFPSEDEIFTAPIAIGRVGFETPQGIATVERKVMNPYWQVPPILLKAKHQAGIPYPKIIPPSPENPLGHYAITLSLEDYVIHGTNDPSSIGKRVSAGCIRLYPEDIQILFDLVMIGTPVKITQ